jgi:hypothetical protein
MLTCTGEAVNIETAAAIKAVYHAAWKITTTATTTATMTDTATASTAADTDTVAVENESQQQQQQRLDWQSLLAALSAVGESPLPSGFSEGLHRAAVAVGATVGVPDIVKLSSELQLLVLGAETWSASRTSGSSVSTLHAQAVQHKLHTLLPSAVTMGAP